MDAEERVSKRAIFAVGLLLFLWALFYWGADFSLRASFVIAFVIGSLGTLWIYDAPPERQTKEFRPYYVRIEPEWHRILTDYELISTNEEWAKIRDEVIYANTDARYNVLREGLTFTVLSRDVYYWNNDCRFSSKLDFRVRMREFAEPEPTVGPPYVPEFFVRGTADGYSIGIATVESFKKIHMVGDNEELIELARVPAEEFLHYRVNVSGQARKELERELIKHGWKELETELREQGWTRENLHELHRGEIVADFPEKLEHKYFRVYHRGI